MKVCKLFSIMVVLCFVLNACLKSEEQTKEVDATKQISTPTYFDGNRIYTIAIAEAMPAEQYSFRPTDSVRSFGEQMMHIALSTRFFMDTFVHGEEMPDEEGFAEIRKIEAETGVDKAAVIQLLRENYDYAEELFEQLNQTQLDSTFTVAFDPESPEFKVEKAFDFMREHTSHHRGQAVMYLRLQGISPPDYKLY